MSRSTHYLSGWWLWWSNPLKALHPSMQPILPFTPATFDGIDYLKLLEMRSFFELHELPDEQLKEHPELQSLALALPQDLSNHLVVFSVLTLDSFILKANASEWENNYGIGSPESARQIIRLWNERPPELTIWQEAMVTWLQANTLHPCQLEDRIQLGLAVYLKSCFPKLYRRWQLTLHFDIQMAMKTVPLLAQETLPALQQWVAPSLQNLHTEVCKRFEQEDLELSLEDDELDEQLSELRSLEGEFDA